MRRGGDWRRKLEGLGGKGESEAELGVNYNYLPLQGLEEKLLKTTSITTTSANTTTTTESGVQLQLQLLRIVLWRSMDEIGG